CCSVCYLLVIFFFQAEDGIRYRNVTGVQTCALPIWNKPIISVYNLVHSLLNSFDDCWRNINRIHYFGLYLFNQRANFSCILICFSNLRNQARSKSCSPICNRSRVLSQLYRSISIELSKSQEHCLTSILMNALLTSCFT